MHVQQREALSVELCPLSEEKALHKVPNSQEVVPCILYILCKREKAYNVLQIREGGNFNTCIYL